MFYILPKIHKTKVKGFITEKMPVVSFCGTDLYEIGKFEDFYLK